MHTGLLVAEKQVYSDKALFLLYICLKYAVLKWWFVFEIFGLHKTHVMGPAWVALNSFSFLLLTLQVALGMGKLDLLEDWKVDWAWPGKHSKILMLVELPSLSETTVKHRDGNTPKKEHNHKLSLNSMTSIFHDWFPQYLFNCFYALLNNQTRESCLFLCDSFLRPGVLGMLLPPLML